MGSIILYYILPLCGVGYNYAWVIWLFAMLFIRPKTHNTKQFCESDWDGHYKVGMHEKYQSTVHQWSISLTYLIWFLVYPYNIFKQYLQHFKELKNQPETKFEYSVPQNSVMYTNIFCNVPHFYKLLHASYKTLILEVSRLQINVSV